LTNLYYHSSVFAFLSNIKLKLNKAKYFSESVRSIILCAPKMYSTQSTETCFLTVRNARSNFLEITIMRQQHRIKIFSNKCH
tara:strand:+ start:33688 stop:33933 length:246 start_codon:yes stop_codon:yes gene_type:complete